MVGYKFCEKMVEKGGMATFDIIVYGEEPRPAYDRVHLSEYFDGSTVEDLTMAPREWYEKNGISLITSALVTDLDTSQKTISTHQGKTDSYDILILATGSYPFVPPIEGSDKTGVFVYRTIEDLDAMIAHGKKSKTCAVLGGGLLGLEAAKATLNMGLKTTAIEFAPRLMPRQLDQKGSDILTDKLENIGINIMCNKSTKLIGGEGKVEKLIFSDGEELPIDMLVISTGIRARDELAKKANIEIGPRGGIVVNDYLSTSAKDVYAIGESALHGGMIYGLVAPGYEMADVVATNLITNELKKSFASYDMSTKLKLAGVDVASFGDAFCEEVPHTPIVFENKITGVYKRINVTNDGKYLLGGILVGDASQYNILTQYVLNQMVVPEDPSALIVGSPDSGGGASIDALPDEALICSCEAVSKGSICCTVKDGSHTFGEVKAATKAGSGCGGCVPMVKDLIEYTLKDLGIVVKKVVCEHFDYSRQELYDIVKIQGIQSYNELLDKHGKGHGCEICKPVVASIFASQTAETPSVQNTIQDTNDKFLANIQRNGTYSVVPRIPGGEIKPEGLIVIGQVAQKYGLYTKITGGQRIDLFGAKLNDLPKIWKELVDAGFESGHAYGKSLRTVKSCVGNTWCRYGVQDSVTMAVDLENRYRGIRSPHKLKGGVSGCVRECAEAQGKDFGVIATEVGWNLYVCGNGGAKPQHALLFAQDIDSDTLIKYLDRFLMFYIKTADPLTRTATWLNKMDGGLNYLTDVIINDSLGICDTLEKEMEELVNNFRCEWAECIEDPNIQKRFTHFINSESEDETLEWVDMRGQSIPAPWIK